MSKMTTFPLFRIDATDSRRLEGSSTSSPSSCGNVTILEYHNTLFDAAKRLGKVTINPDYLVEHHRSLSHPRYVRREKQYRFMSMGMHRGMEVSRPTLLKEIVAVPRPGAVAELLDREREVGVKQKGFKTKPIGRNEFVKTMADAVLDFIEKEWKPGGQHAIMHSSGWDSRIFSTALRRKADEHGKDWLGKLFVVAIRPEVNEARQILDIEEWKGFDVTVIEGGAGVPDIDFHAEPFEFDNIGRMCSDVNRVYLQGIWYWTAKALKEWCNLEDIQFISTIYGNEIYRVKNGYARDLGIFLATFMTDIYFELGRYDVALPFLSRGWTTNLLKYSLPMKEVELKQSVINYFNPKVMAVKKYAIRGPWEFYRLSDGKLAEMQDAYDQSWYRKTYGKEVKLTSPIENESLAWKAYFTSAICEFYIKQGISVN